MKQNGERYFCESVMSVHFISNINAYYLFNDCVY
jgi:hypothetical protein